jgi:type II secretory pathway pseudopilin PulG
MTISIYRQRRSRGGRPTRAGFTMVEIALSLAVVAFALVAIMGVLPTGVTVQKENREDTLINQEGRYWLEAIRTGARGLHDITNYVELIQVITNYDGRVEFMPADTAKLPSGTSVTLKGDFYTDLVAKPLSPTDVMALLSTLKYEGATNNIIAQVKAITGPAAEQGSLTNQFSFRYQLHTEITADESLMQIIQKDALARAVITNPPLFDVRVVLRWPVTQRGNKWAVGNNKKTFRAKIAGVRQPVDSNNITLARKDYKFIVPNQF